MERLCHVERGLRLHHPVWLNVGKHQRKASWLRSLRFSSTLPHPQSSQSEDPQIRNIAFPNITCNVRWSAFAVSNAVFDSCYITCLLTCFSLFVWIRPNRANLCKLRWWGGWRDSVTCGGLRFYSRWHQNSLKIISRFFFFYLPQNEFGYGHLCLQAWLVIYLATAL